jgi:hypothetical protein
VLPFLEERTSQGRIGSDGQGKQSPRGRLRVGLIKMGEKLIIGQIPAPTSIIGHGIHGAGDVMMASKVSMVALM